MRRRVRKVGRILHMALCGSEALRCRLTSSFWVCVRIGVYLRNGIGLPLTNVLPLSRLKQRQCVFLYINRFWSPDESPRMIGFSYRVCVSLIAKQIATAIWESMADE